MDKIISIVGLTSSGKSDLAIKLAKHFDGEIVSADSRQVYKGLDFCSGKVSASEQAEVPHHLLDVTQLGKQFTLFDYQNLAYKEIDDILSRKKLPILVGGTGLYVRSVVEGYNLDKSLPNEQLRERLENLSIDELKDICFKMNIEIPDETTKRRLIRILEKNDVDPSNIEDVLFKQNQKNSEQLQNSPRFEVLQLGIKWDREKIYERIKNRLISRMPNMIDEIKVLLDGGTSADFLKSLGLEAKCVTDYVCGNYQSYDEFFEDLFKQERHFAKRQQTWFNKDKYTIWLDAEDNLFESAVKLVEEFLNK